MNIYLPMNAVIIPIVRNEKTHYFFLDTGFPISFTIDQQSVSSINNKDLGIGYNFELQLHKNPIDINPLSEMLMVELTGFLGMDFVSQFDNMVLDYKEKTIEFNQMDFKPDYVIPLKNINPRLEIELSIVSNEKHIAGKCLVDTGAYQSVFSNNDIVIGNYWNCASGFKFPTPSGEQTFNLYAGIEVSCEGIIDFGEQVMMLNQDISHTYDYVLGANILSQYKCCFNIKDKQLQLQENPREFRYGADLTEDLQVVGIQLIKEKKYGLCVYNILDGFEVPSELEEGVQVWLSWAPVYHPDDNDDVEMVNNVWKALSYKVPDELKAKAKVENVVYIDTKEIVVFSGDDDDDKKIDLETRELFW